MTNRPNPSSEGLQNPLKLYQDLVETSQDLIWQCDAQGRYTYLNPAWETTFGYTIDEMLGRKFSDFQTPEMAKRDIGEFNRLMQGTMVKGLETIHIGKAGNQIHLVFNAKCILDDKGIIVGTRGTAQEITVRKEAQADLLESERTFRKLFEDSSDAILLIDETGVFVNCNQAALNLLKMTREQFLFLPPANISPEFQPNGQRSEKAAREMIDLAYQKGLHRFDWTCRNTEGEDFIVEVSLMPIVLKGKTMLHTIWRDITDRKRAEEALRDSKAAYQKQYAILSTLLDNLTTGVFMVEVPSGRPIIANPEAQRLLGRGIISNASKENLAEVYRARKPGYTTPYPVEEMPIVRGMHGESTHVDDMIVERPDGKETWLEVFGSPIRNEHGEVWASLVSFQDITERKQTQEAIAAEKERLAVTLRSIGDGVITTDIHGTIVLMSKVAEELTGWKQDEAQGQNLLTVFTIIDKSTRELLENPVHKVLATGEIIVLANHTLLISRDGTERIISVSEAPIRDKNGSTTGVVLVFRDMTEKQRFLEMTQNSQKLESLGVLAGGIAHDFNNLMGGIYGYINLANCEPDKNRSNEHLSKAMNTIDRARALTLQLLTFAKGGVPIQEIGPLFPMVEQTARFALSGANVSCHFDIQADLWACNFDKNQIGQVIDNLIINAQQAMPAGGTIILTARNISLSGMDYPLLKTGDYVKISVKDSGIGIPKEIIARIFDPFFTTKAMGHGLGLATCYSIINRHGGCIDVESEPGKGTTFTLYLPASATAVFPLHSKAARRHSGSGTFLVMDDEEVMRETISYMLKTLGYTVVSKAIGEDAIEFFLTETKANRTLAGMIFDLTVPGGLGGKKTIKEIRKTNTAIPAFVASGYADDPVMIHPTDYGFTASICKPFMISELCELLNRYMKPK